MKEYCADFETTSKILYLDSEKKKVDIKNSFAFVCRWAIAESCCDSEKDVLIGSSIVEFFKYCENLGKCTIFFHNLKYDGYFIIWYALTKKYNIIDSNIDDAFYSFTVQIGKSKITFRDSLKIYPYKIEYLGNLFGIQKLVGDWDYSKFILPSTKLSEKELDYLRHDVLILCKAIKDIRERGYKKNTIASIAYEERFKLTFPTYQNSKRTKPKEIRPLPMDIQRKLNLAYYGGFCYLSPVHALQWLENVESFDENSMYPDKLKHALLPYGNCHIFLWSKIREELCKKRFECIIYHCKISCKLKSIYHLPVLMFKNSNKAIRHQGKIIECENEDVYLTDIDLKMAINEYNFTKLEKLDLFCFRGKTEFYKNFVENFGGQKDKIAYDLNFLKENGGDKSDILRLELERFNVKRILNTSYGKDGTKISRESRKFYIKDKILRSDCNFEEIETQFYLPHAIYTCARARFDLYQMIKRVGKDFIYCDTDSVKTFKKTADRVLKDFPECFDNNEIGKWKDEGNYSKAKFLRQKTYCYIENGENELNFVACGITNDVKKLLNENNFDIGTEISVKDVEEYNEKHKNDENFSPIECKLRFVPVKGGVALVSAPFKIREGSDDTYNLTTHLTVEGMKKYFGVNEK